MKKTYSILLTCMLLLSAFVTYGQGYSFRVLANKGQNKVKKAGSTETVALKTGATINAGDELIVGNGSYIGLMHKTGKTLEVRESGTIKVSSLESKIAAKDNSMANRYAQFIASKMSGQNNSYAARMNATGATERAAGGDDISILLPDRVDIISDNAIIEWIGPEGTDENTSYIVTVSNIFDDVMYEETVTGNTIAIDFSNEQLQNENNFYLVAVKLESDEEIVSKNVGIKKMSAEENEEVVTNYNSLKSEISEDSPLNKLIYASFFEENNLLLDAMTKYQEAIEMSPDVEDFQEMYQGFKIKNGLEK